ncbi:hypothetical protein [Phenylobacterium montanum]|uniref:Uncharacterized protein n=1 Tax=Phenylobacterium montanum TaxID=2823693 RepID=A0A975IW65_9CAUL|nr:hypothetical protein [Caulobacter sp. S6]QUD89505.1 hypothetical protein KCG34_06385 [Caulobacter sp. S6]
MAIAFRAEVEKLHEALATGDDPEQRQFEGPIRFLIDAMVATPGYGQLVLDVRGDLAGILSIADKQKPFGRDPKGLVV